MYFPDVVVGTGLVAVESDRVISIELVLPMNSWGTVSDSGWLLMKVYCIALLI
jgi:hypothetical protein